MPTSYSGSVRVYGANRQGPNADIGDTTLVQQATLAFGDAGSAQDLFILPPNAVPIEFYADTTTVFSAATTLDIGTTASGNRFADGVTVTSVGRVLGTSDVSQVPEYADLGSAATQITAQLTGAGLTTGAITIRCLYWINNALSD